MTTPDRPRAHERELDLLMTVLVELHEAGVITDPSVSAENGDVEGSTAVTVEFLLGYPRDV